MFESKYLSNPNDLQKFELLKKKFYNTKSVVESTLANSNKVNPFTGETLSNTQIIELQRKKNLISQIEPLLVPEYGKFQDFFYYYNNGQFRTEEEIKSYKQMKIQQDWSVCEEFNKNTVVVLIMVSLLSAFFFIAPFMIIGRSAIMIYMFPIWPLITIVGAFSLYKFAMARIFNQKKGNKKQNEEKEIRKYYRYGTTLSFMQKYF